MTEPRCIPLPLVQHQHNQRQRHQESLHNEQQWRLRQLEEVVSPKQIDHDYYPPHLQNNCTATAAIDCTHEALLRHRRRYHQASSIPRQQPPQQQQSTKQQSWQPHLRHHGSRQGYRWWGLVTVVLLLSRGASAQSVRLLEQVSGSTVALPCNAPITPDTQNLLVLWYKGSTSKATYVFESKTSLELGETRFNGDLLVGDRATFQALHDPPALVIEDVRVEDEAVYKCKVFIAGRMYQDKSNLSVIVPPDPPTIINSAGEELDLTAVTYSEGDTVDLTCQVTGGKPSPAVSWYWDKELLDSSHDTVGTGVVRNRLLFGPLTRNHTDARMVCHANTYKLVTPLATVFRLNVQFKPTSVKIVSDDSPMQVGKTYRLQCQSLGASPPALLSWYLQGKLLANDSTHRIYNQVPEGANMTLSTLELSPLIQNKQNQLQCRAASPVIQHAPLVDSRSLVIHYMGSVELKVLGSEPKKGVVEGQNVTMRCTVDSDPPPKHILWYHKVASKIQKVPGKEGVEVVLERVSRNDSGVYTCVASNIVENRHSNPVMLEVHYKPKCRESGVQMVGTGAYEQVKLACKVNSSPEPTSYRWELNTTGKMIDMPEESVSVHDQMSILSYTPKTDFDYGILLCWAENAIGKQRRPCRFELVSAVLPTPLTNCSVSNNETHVVYIDCQSDTGNSLPLTYIAEVYDITDERLLRNVTSSNPSFLIEELDPGSGFTVQAYSSNIRGHSEKLQFHAFTAPLITKTVDYSSIHVFPITPILGILVGIVGAVVIMALILVVVMKLKSSKASPGNKLKCGEPPIMMPMDEQAYNHKYGRGSGVGGGPAKTTLINFPAEPAAATVISEKPRPKEPPSIAALTPPAPPTDDVEYADLEFPNDKKLKKKRKKSKSKKKKEMKDEETEYADIDHEQTMLNSQQLLDRQQKLQQKLNKELKQQQQLDPDPGRQPLIRVEGVGGVDPSAPPDGDDRGRLVLPDGALESSV